MGFNTGILILNDAIYAAEKDPKSFGENLLDGLREHVRGNLPVDFSIGNNVNGGTVFWQAHADLTGVVAIGGNCTSHLLSIYNGGHHHTVDQQIRILGELAAQMGYKLVRKKE